MGRGTGRVREVTKRNGCKREKIDKRGGGRGEGWRKGRGERRKRKREERERRR